MIEREMHPIAIVAMHMGVSRERAIRMVQRRELEGELRNGTRWVATLPTDQSKMSPPNNHRSNNEP
jgi:hypothetical protein